MSSRRALRSRSLDRPPQSVQQVEAKQLQQKLWRSSSLKTPPVSDVVSTEYNAGQHREPSIDSQYRNSTRRRSRYDHEQHCAAEGRASAEYSGSGVGTAQRKYRKNKDSPVKQQRPQSTKFNEEERIAHLLSKITRQLASLGDNSSTVMSNDGDDRQRPILKRDIFHQSLPRTPRHKKVSWVDKSKMNASNANTAASTSTTAANKARIAAEDEKNNNKNIAIERNTSDASDVAAEQHKAAEAAKQQNRTSQQTVYMPATMKYKVVSQQHLQQAPAISIRPHPGYATSASSSHVNLPTHSASSQLPPHHSTTTVTAADKAAHQRLMSADFRQPPKPLDTFSELNIFSQYTQPPPAKANHHKSRHSHQHQHRHKTSHHEQTDSNQYANFYVSKADGKRVVDFSPPPKPITMTYLRPAHGKVLTLHQKTDNRSTTKGHLQPIQHQQHESARLTSRRVPETRTPMKSPPQLKVLNNNEIHVAFDISLPDTITSGLK